MGWIASFKGLRKAGLPPLVAMAALAVAFIVARMVSGSTEEAGAAT